MTNKISRAFGRLRTKVILLLIGDRPFIANVRIGGRLNGSAVGVTFKNCMFEELPDKYLALGSFGPLHSGFVKIHNDYEVHYAMGRVNRTLDRFGLLSSTRGMPFN